MDALGVGEVILGLHQNLTELRRAAAAGGGNPALQSQLDQAEAALRAQARDFLAAANHAAPGSIAATAAAQARQQSPARHRGGASQPPLHLPLPASPAAKVIQQARAESVGAGDGGPMRRKRPLRAPSRGARHRSKTTEANRGLPKANRLDPLSDPPHLTERDMDRGLLSLTNRGFIPTAADLTPALERGMPVMLQRPAPLYDQMLKHARREIAPADDLLAVKLDCSAPDERLSRSLPEHFRSGGRHMQAASAGAMSARALPPLAPSGASVTVLALPALPAPPPLPGEQPADRWREANGGGGGGGTTGVGETFGTFFTDLLDSAPEPPQHAGYASSYALVPVATGPSNEEIRELAATFISSHWRGLRQRRQFAQKLRADRAARHIQSSWATALTRIITKTELHRIQQEERVAYTRLMEDFGQDWFQSKQMRRVEVHISSLTFSETRRQHIESYQALQAAQISRIFRLMDPKRDVIFVAPKQLHEDVLDYYAKIMQFRGIKNPPGRFQVVVPENMHLTHRLSLSQGLLCSPKALKRIKKLVSGRQAYIVPDVVSHTELKISAALNLPLFGAGPRNMALTASKSNGKKLAQLAELPIGPWAADIYDEDEFFTSLAGLVVKFPHIRTWLFKIDDERDSRGLAYVDVSKIREVSEAVRYSGHVAGHSSSASGGGTAGGGGGGAAEEQTPAAVSRREASEEPALVGSDATEVRHALRRFVPKRACLCNRGAYPDFGAWLAEATRVGCVIQAVPDSILAQTSVHVQIDPDGAVNVLGTSEAVTSQPFVRAASFFPHTRGNWEVLQEVGLRMGHVLAGKRVVGFASVDIVFFENPNFDPMHVGDEDREPTPIVIGGDTPVDPRHLMFSDLRSPSPAMSSDSQDRWPMPISLPESRQADYDLAMQLKDLPPKPKTNSAVSMVLGVSPNVGASPSSHFACWVVDVDARLTDEAASLFPLQFTAQLRLDSSTGHFRLTTAAQAGDSVDAPEDDADARTRWALVSRIAAAPGLERMSHQALFQAAKMRGVSYDLFHNIGTIFTFLDVVHSLFSLLTVDRTPETCAKRLASGVSALMEGAAQSSSGKAGAKPKVSAPRELNPPESDNLLITDVQVALRAVQKRWVEKSRT